MQREQLINFHCFTGTTVTLEEWVSAFPNTYFGVNAAAGKLESDEQSSKEYLPFPSSL